MSTAVSPTKEYCVRVKEVGWVSVIIPTHPLVGADYEPTVFDNEPGADGIASKVASEYRRLGLPKLAEKVEVLSRQVVVTREEWLFEHGAARP